MEEFVRRLIHEKRVNIGRCAKPSEAFQRFFDPEHGVVLPPPERCGDRPVSFSDEDNA